MKKVIPFILSMACFACASTPPDWWNPGNRYSGETAPAEAEVAPVGNTILQQELLPVDEESIAVYGETIEEEMLAPLPVTSPEPIVQEATEMVIPKVEEHLPEDGSLPFPSVIAP